MLDEIADDLEPELLRLLARPPVSWPTIDDRSSPWFAAIPDSDRAGSTIGRSDRQVRQGIGFLVSSAPERCHPISDWMADRYKLRREAIWEVQGLDAPEPLGPGMELWPTAKVRTIRLVRKLPSWRRYGQHGETVAEVIDRARSVPAPFPVAASYRSPAFRDQFFAASRATNWDPVVDAMTHAWESIDGVLTERADRHDPATIEWRESPVGGVIGYLDDPAWRRLRDELTMSAVRIIAGT